MAGTISVRKLSEAMRLGAPGEHVVLRSRRAFDHIRFVGAEPAEAETYYTERVERDRDARRAYRALRHPTDSMGEIYMLDIMREGIDGTDPRIP